jgi:hypothetical protein
MVKAVMNISTAWKVVFLAILAATLVAAPRAIADDINPDADIPDASSLSDADSPPNQVLEIPQQCDQDSVAILCDRSEDESSPSPDANAVATSADANGSSAVANNPDLGSVYDYANQNITSEASAAGTMNVPAYGTGYPVLSPGPAIVSSGPGGYQQWAAGPGSYQQWAAGPGSYQQLAPGPGYIQPMPLGYRPYGLTSNFAPRPFGGGFGRR